VVLGGAGGFICTPDASAPRPGDRITVILPDAHAGLEARVTAGEPPAEQDARRCYLDDATRATRRALSLGQGQDRAPAVGIGVLRARTSLQLGADLRADLDGDGKPESFKACTSSEGVHLTVWSGTPLKAGGVRRWHAYYYLDYDTEPSCSPGET